MRHSLIVAGLACAFTVTAYAAATPEEAAKLGKELTAVGAEAGPNADGSIPKWTGPINFTAEQKALTLTKVKDLQKLASKTTPAAFKANVKKAIEGGDISDAIPPELKTIYEGVKEQIGASGKRTVSITAANMAQYESKLTEGHKALLKAYPTYKMNVFPTVRTAFYPDEFNAATAKNALSAKLQGTDDVLDAKLGFAFPIPKSGAEVIWNHKLNFRGSAATRYNDQAIVKPEGGFKLTKVIEDVKFKYGNIKEPPAADNKILAYYLAKTIAPPRVAGQTYLVQEPFIGNRVAYIYTPSLGRVNRAPDVGYDNPSVGTDGEQFNDQVDMFNGALDRYTWKLVGKKEIYIPYNSYLVNTTTLLPYAELLTPLHLNQDYARYELHRVWVVEADLKPGQRHQFKKRRFYMDEDSWRIAAVDCYDNRDQLWKFQEGHLITIPFLPTLTSIPELIYDLQSRRYFTTAMINEGEIVNFEAQFPDSYFDPANLKRLTRGQ